MKPLGPPEHIRYEGFALMELEEGDRLEVIRGSLVVQVRDDGTMYRITQMSETKRKAQESQQGTHDEDDPA